jgi:hypothetical protein
MDAAGGDAMKAMVLGSMLLLAAAEADTDGDGIPDAEDRCPAFASADQKDSDGDGIGDVCQCGDANGDGRVNVSDIVAAKEMIDGKTAVSPLCDADQSGSCDSNDIGVLNAAIFGSCAPVCARHPGPPAGKTACPKAAFAPQP